MFFILAIISATTTTLNQFYEQKKQQLCENGPEENPSAHKPILLSFANNHRSSIMLRNFAMSSRVKPQSIENPHLFCICSLGENSDAKKNPHLFSAIVPRYLRAILQNYTAPQAKRNHLRGRSTPLFELHQCG